MNKRLKKFIIRFYLPLDLVNLDPGPNAVTQARKTKHNKNVCIVCNILGANFEFFLLVVGEDWKSHSEAKLTHSRQKTDR